MSRRDVCAAASMDVWAAAVLAFELLRTPGEEAGGQALFGSKEEVGWLDGFDYCIIGLSDCIGLFGLLDYCVVGWFGAWSS